jgi:hypothetical protein
MRDKAACGHRTMHNGATAQTYAARSSAPQDGMALVVAPGEQRFPRSVVIDVTYRA